MDGVALGPLALQIVTVLVPMLLSLTVHEYAHALAARRLGDDTATMLGRLTLNPLSHIDPIGTLLVPIAATLASAAGGVVPFFGWAKPVPINPLRFTRRLTMLRGVMLTAAAGPLANLLLALVFAALLAVAYHAGALPGLPVPLAVFCNLMVWINLILALFNLVPVYPLDGQKVLAGLLGGEFGQRFDLFMRRFGSFGLILLVLASWQLGIFGPALLAVYRGLTGGLLGIPLAVLAELF